MRPAIRSLWLVASSILALGLGGTGYGAISTHLSWGQIAQSRIYDDPNVASPTYLFQMEVDTDASVAYVEFITPAGFRDVIPADEQLISGDIETYHWVDGSTDVWEYWGYCADTATLALYGNGWYVIVLHYTNGAREQTTVWYGIPGTTQPLPTPTQRPSILWPQHDGFVASPVTFTWEAVTDPTVADAYLNVTDSDGQYVIADAYDPGTTDSDPYGLTEGTYNVKLMFESFYATNSIDGIPFDVLRSSTLLQPFEVVAGSVYRFWSPITGRHFYTIDEDEKNVVLQKYPYFWLFEGPVLYAWTTQYGPDMAPVYRFWSSQSGSHFYTISEAEKNKLINTLAYFWTYEGVAFYAYAPGRQPADTSPVYRFWKRSDNTHFYTIDPRERDKLVSQFSAIYTYEGIAYYAWQ